MAERGRRRRSCIASTLPRPSTPGRIGTCRGRARAGRSADVASCDRTMIQSSSTAWVNSSALRVTKSSGKSSNAVTQRGLAAHGRISRSPKNARVRAPSPVPRTITAWWPAECPPVGTTVTSGMISCSPSTQPCLPHVSTSRSSGWTYEATRRGLSPSATSHSACWATIVACGNAFSPSARSRPPAWSKWRWLIATTLTLSGGNPAASRARHDPRAFVAAHRPGLVVDPVADPGLDQHAPRARLDQQAVECLEQPALVVDLVLDEAAPQDPRHGPEQRPGVGAEGARLDQRDPNATTEFAGPVHRVVHRHRPTPAR